MPSLKCFCNSRLYTQVILFFCLLISAAAGLFAQPVITGVSPSAGALGTNVTITGTGFGATPLSNAVFFGSVRATVAAASTTTLTVIVPPGINARLLSVTYNGLTGYSAMPFDVSFPFGGVFNGGSFTAAVTNPAPGYIYSIANADIDGDGKTDLLTADFTGQSFTVYKNQSSTTINFTNSVSFATGNYTTAVATGDINGDGKPDVVTGYFGTAEIRVFINTSTPGNFSFAAGVIFPIPQAPSKMVIADIDMDGKPDVAAAGNNSLFVMRNESAGNTIAFSTGVPVPGGQYIVTAGDLTGDGKPELVGGSGSDLLVSVNTSTPGNISFDAPVTFSNGHEAASLVIADINGDQKPEIAAVNYYSTDINIFKNTGSGNALSLAAPQSFAVGHAGSDIDIADADGDTKPDIICTNSDYAVISVLRNTSSSVISFDTHTDYATAGAFSTGLAVADFNNDGRPDLAGISNTSNIIFVLANKIGAAATLGSFTPSGGGEGTVVNITGTNLTNTTAVSFGGVAAASFTVISDTSISAVVGAAGASGNISVTTVVNNVSLSRFAFSVRPSISAVYPLKANAGQRARITGSGFSSSPGGNTVYFGAAKATVINAGVNVIDVLVPAGATYQPIAVSTNGYCVQSPKPFTLTWANGTLSAATFRDSYKPPVNFNEPHNTSLADIDGDGKTDIIVNIHGTSVGSFPYNDSFGVYRNATLNGVVSFSDRVSFKTTGQLTKNVSFADVDGDGKPDVIVLNEWLYSGAGSVNIFRNTSTPGNISFGDPVSLGAGVLTTNISIADIDADGKLDFAVADGSAQVFVFRNSSSAGGISFAAAQPYSLNPLSGGCLSVWLGDADNDGKPDLIATDAGRNDFYLFKNTSTVGNISLAARQDYTIGHHTSFVTMADIDADGAPDIVLGSGVYNNYSSGDSTIIVLRNQGRAGAFVVDPSPLLITCRAGNIAVSDADGDGRPDLLTPDNISVNSVSVFRNTSTAAHISFDTRLSVYPSDAINIAGIATGDVDNDGKPDIVIADNSGVVLHVMINQNAADLSLCANGGMQLYSNLTGTVYQWQINTGNGFTDITDNSNYAGTTSPALTLSNIPTSRYGYQLRCLANGIEGKVTTLKFASTWTGAVNTAWENAGNWSCGLIPDKYTDVIINAGTVIVSSAPIIHSLLLNPGVVITVTTPYKITITN